MQLPNSFKTAVKTFQDSSDMTRAEAKVFVARELAGWSRPFASDALEKSKSTIDNQHQAAKKKTRLPGISKVEAQKRVGDDRVVDIWFGNDARLRYRATDSDPDRDTILEQTFRADDSETVDTTTELAIDPAELDATALGGIGLYLDDYRDDINAMRDHWTNLFSALTCHKA